MTLELVPIEKQSEFSNDEIEEIKQRTRDIKPEEIKHFTEKNVKEIKHFLVCLVTVSEFVHYDMEHQEDIPNFDLTLEHLTTYRQKLFNDPKPAVSDFIKLLQLCPMEPWREFEILIQDLKNEDRRRYFEIQNNTGITNDNKNSFLMQTEDDQYEKIMDEQQKTKRLTPNEMEDLIIHFTLWELVYNLVKARKILTGQFWEVGYYDL